jgi:hypothetical protein
MNGASHTISFAVLYSRISPLFRSYSRHDPPGGGSRVTAAILTRSVNSWLTEEFLPARWIGPGCGRLPCVYTTVLHLLLVHYAAASGLWMRRPGLKGKRSWKR